MQKRMRLAMAMLVALPILGFLGAWPFVSSSDLAEQTRLEGLLLGKTVDQIEAILAYKPWVYVTRDQTVKRHGECLWPSESDAVAHWSKGRPTRDDNIAVVFNKTGIATSVVFHSAHSQKLRRWRFLNFFDL